MDSDKNCPDCKVNEMAKNPNGQRHSMQGIGTVGAFTPPNADMHTTKNIKIDPASTFGHRRFDND
jgi:hypothetical protein